MKGRNHWWRLRARRDSFHPETPSPLGDCVVIRKKSCHSSRKRESRVPGENRDPVLKMVPGVRRDGAWMPAPGFRWDKLRGHDKHDKIRTQSLKGGIRGFPGERRVGFFEEKWGKGRGDGIKILPEFRFKLAKRDSKINIIRKRKSTKVRVLKEDRRDEYSE